MYAPATARLSTPVGWIVVEGDASVVRAIRLTSSAGQMQQGHGAVREAALQLAAYFNGTLRRFDLPLAPAASARGAVLRDAIAAIGFGSTAGYGELARAVSSSARALGQACARNPFPIVIPCHRVLRAGGILGPYSAGDGPTTKRWLLAFEAAP